MAIDHSIIRRFPRQLLLMTDGISYLVIIPLVVFHLWLNMGLDDAQVRLAQVSTGIAIGLTLIPVLYLSRRMLGPVTGYFNAFLENRQVSQKEYDRAFDSFINIPYNMARRAFLNYAFGLGLISAVMIVMGNLSGVQRTNLLMVALVIPFLAAIIYFILSEILVQKCIMTGCFHTWYIDRSSFRLPLALRIVILTLTNFLVPFLILYSFLLYVSRGQAEAQQRTIALGALIGLMGVVISLFLSYLLARSILLKIGIINKSIHLIGDGDLQSKLIKIGTNDEFQTINAAIGKVRMNLNSTVRSINTTMQQLTESSGTLTDKSTQFADTAQTQASSLEQINATVEELSAGIETISHNTEEQYGKIHLLSEIMSRLSDVMEETASKTRESTRVTDDMDESVRNGENSLNAMIDNMNRIMESSSRMNGIVEIISDISDKINLLSLNAAIESARAGTAGRGFAVVADEISKLADQTAGSIKEINGLILLNNDETKKGIANVAVTKSAIERITGNVKTIVRMMKIIESQMEQELEENRVVRENVEKIKNMTEMISTSTSEHKTGMTEIVRTISTVNEGTQVVSTGADDIFGKSRELTGIVDSLKTTASFFKI